MSDKFKDQYQRVQKKFNLPSFEQLDQEFDIGSLEESNFPLRQIRRQISEVLETYAKLLEELMHPESSISGLYELKELTDADKDALFDNYRHLIRLLRYSLEIALKNSEQDDAAFINDLVKQWPLMRKSLLPLAKKLKDSWEHETAKKEDLGYLG
jgi:hypothetical protein